MTCPNFTRVPYEGSATPAGAAVEVLYNSASLANSGVEMPLEHSQICWVVFHIKAATNANNALLVEYSNDKGVTFTTLSSTTVGTAAVEAEVYVGHFQHIRVSFVNGTLLQASALSINLSLHSNDRSPIGL